MIEVDIKLKRDKFDVIIQETFHEGITGVFGPSGSGKTSLMNSICGLVTPEEGEISIMGRKVYSSKNKINIPVEKRKIGYVFQEGRLFPHMTVEQNLRYGMKKTNHQHLSFENVVEMLNLGHLLHRKSTGISGGERQRTAIGRSLLSSPEILLLDEPFSAVDVNLRGQIIPFLLKIQQSINIPILVVSHDITDLLRLSNKLCIIQSGRCIGHDGYHRLLRNSETQKILGSHSLINAIKLNVRKSDNESGLTVLSINNTENQVRVVCEKSKGIYQPGDNMRIYIRPHDIALSSKKIEEITIQNQLEGIIVDIIENESIRLCTVDVGFPLLVEVTAQSLKRMEIKIGSKVWCLFKSVAIDVAG